jgi:probable HAF family extracellular repeat protein
MRVLMERLVVPAAVFLVAGASYGGKPEDSDGDGKVRYEVKNLSSFPGDNSSGNSINDLGWITGTSDQAVGAERRASLWLFGFQFDLRTLGGPSSGVIWPVKNNLGLISGISETALTDPNGETWSCGAFLPKTGHTCLGVVWEWGHIRALPTLGGPNGFATGTNNQRRTVGWAENTVHDSSCTGKQVLQFRAVMWGPGKDDVQELPPLEGDSVSAATAINDRGQVVGISGACGTAVGGVSAKHAVIWENGSPNEIPNLGGVAWNTPMAMNEWGDVVGFSNVSASDGAAFNAQPFIWTKRDGTKPIKLLSGDVLGQALGINNWRQVVGLSCTAGFASCRGFLWQDGVTTDLNELVAPGYPDQIIAGGDINDLGRITGQAVNPAGTELSAFLAVPIGGRWGVNEARGTRSVHLSQQARRSLLQRLRLAGVDG